MTPVGRDPRRRRVTVKDVAAAANVSPMTVSNVINGRHQFVSEATRKLVEKEIARRNYRVQESARGLRTAYRRSVGIAIVDETRSFLSDHFNAQVVAGLSNVLSRNNHTLMVQGIPPRQFSKSMVVQNFAVDGFCVIMSGPPARRREIVETLIKLDQPVVLIQETGAPEAPDICVVRQDDDGGARVLADHFAARRPSRYLVIRPETEWAAIEARVSAFCQATARLAPEAKVDTIRTATEDFDSVQASVAAYLDSQPLPAAIFGANDRLAIGAMLLLQARGIAIPDQVRIAGFNGFESRRYARPLITTVMSPAYALGERAGQALLDRFAEQQFRERDIVLPVHLDFGETT